MKQQLRKPANWQDFESLCKKLWGEIWHCPEIKKNGRQGQKQFGVDVYGLPKDETGYYGIQCKGKDDYTRLSLTTEEIEKEISQARLFRPALKKFYLATTGNKDVAIEQYAREKDLESRRNGSFEVHLFSWEDIVDLIDENPVTYEWYVKGIGFRTNQSVAVSFSNGMDTLKIHPSFLKVKKTFVFSDEPLQILKLGDVFMNNGKKEEDCQIYEDSGDAWSNPQPIARGWGLVGPTKRYNRSCVNFSLQIRNDGSQALENFKLLASVEGDYVSLGAAQIGNGLFPEMDVSEYDCFYDAETAHCVGKPFSNVLVPGDKYTFGDFCIKPKPEVKTLFINWKVLSKSNSFKGRLTLYSVPKIMLAETVSKTSIKEYLQKTEWFYKNDYVSEDVFYGKCERAGGC